MSVALILVDVQNDFCPGGALAVPAGDRVIAPLNRLAAAVSAAGGCVVATRDWHPAQTTHFASSGGVWPDHCVAGTPGAEFHSRLHLPQGTVILSKGTAPAEDAYSGFDAVDVSGKGLAELLHQQGVSVVYVGGLATDYCVKATVLDGIRNGFEVVVVEDGVAGVELQEGDCDRAVATMREEGARFLPSNQIELPSP